MCLVLPVSVKLVYFPCTETLYFLLMFTSTHVVKVADCSLNVFRHQLKDIPHSGKFSRGPNFRDFRDPQPKRENKNHENLNT